MKRHVQNIVALLWIFFGAAGALWSAFDMWQNRRSSSNAFQADGVVIKADALLVGFCLAAALSRVFFRRRLKGGKILLIFSSSVLALYCSSYVLMVGPEFGSGWLITILAFLLFALG